MFFEFFIAKRISLKSKRRFSKAIVRLAVSAIALSLAVMLVSVAIVQGFKHEIRNKVIGFGSHIQIIEPKLQKSIENPPIEVDSFLIDTISRIDGVDHIQSFANKPGIMRSGDDIEGMVYKGVGKDFSWKRFSGYLTEGEKPRIVPGELSNEIIISKYLADRLLLETGDDVIIFFIDDPPRALRPVISGIYETGVTEIDKRFILGDIGQVQRINGWNEFEVGGYEVSLMDFNKIQEVDNIIRSLLPVRLSTLRITRVYPQIFDWLELIDINAIIILSLMLLVAVINMITALLIMILERTPMIGTLKALGADNGIVRRIFVINSAFLIVAGLLIGNAIGIGWILFQDATSFFTLDPDSYYMSFIPVQISLWQIAAINVGTLLICTFVMYVPAMIISRIDPVKSLRFK